MLGFYVHTESVLLTKLISVVMPASHKDPQEENLNDIVVFFDEEMELDAEENEEEEECTDDTDIHEQTSEELGRIQHLHNKGQLLSNSRKAKSKS